MSVVILFTAGYPFGNGEGFLEAEIQVLAGGLDRLVVVPIVATGLPRPLPDSVEVDLSLAKLSASRSRLALKALPSLLGSSLWYAELRRAPPAMRRNPHVLRRVAGFCIRAIAVRDWLAANIPRYASAAEPRLAYTYWMGAATLGAVLARRADPRLRVLSRAHGGDLYDERHSPPYLPFRRAIVAGLDAICSVSEHGASYLRARHPEFSDRIRMARLGVRDPLFQTPCSTDGLFRIVSCSFLKPVKRIDLLIRSLAQFAGQNPDQQLQWDHIGGGPLESELREHAASVLPANLRARFHGHLDNSDVLAFYRNHAVDVFINLSASEGVPVSIMEAQSCAIPVIATAVGGTPEIVSSDNGWLLSDEPSTSEVSSALAACLNSNEERLRKRVRSRDTWAAVYDASLNYAGFLEELRVIMGSADHGASHVACST